MKNWLLISVLGLLVGCESSVNVSKELSNAYLQSESGVISTPDSGSATSTGSDATITLTIKTNSSALRTENVSLASGSQGFSLLTSSCANINSSRTCTVRIKFTVGTKENGTYSDSVVISDLSVPVSVVLNKPVPVNDDSGLTVTEGSSVVTSLNFGTIASSSSVTKTLILKDATRKVTQAISISSSTADYTVLTPSCAASSVNSTAGCTVRLQITGSGKPAGVINANLSLGSKVLAMTTTIQGATPGVADLRLLINDVEVSSKDFGSLVTGSKSSVLVKIKNQGTGASTGNQVGLSGSSAFYVTSSTCTSVIQAGAICQLTLNLNLTNFVGSHQASLSYGSKTLPATVAVLGSCAVSKHAENGSCVSNIQLEIIANGTRSKIYSNATSTWSNWVYQCSANFVVSGEACVAGSDFQMVYDEFEYGKIILRQEEDYSWLGAEEYLYDAQSPEDIVARIESFPDFNENKLYYIDIYLGNGVIFKNPRRIYFAEDNPDTEYFDAEYC